MVLRLGNVLRISAIEGGFLGPRGQDWVWCVCNADVVPSLDRDWRSNFDGRNHCAVETREARGEES